MFRFSIETFQLNDFVTRYNLRMRENLARSLDEIRIGFQQQLRIEQSRGNDGGWKPLSKNYLKRKEREYPGQPILSRTGVMMAGYIKGVRTVPHEAKVVVDFPGTVGFPVNTRAKAHQGVIGRPKNMPIRPIPVSEEGFNDFRNIAIRAFRDAIAKSLAK